MGIHSTFQSFVHSEVKTSSGFRLVEAYLSYRDLESKIQDKPADLAFFEDIEELSKDGSLTKKSLDSDFTSGFFSNAISPPSGISFSNHPFFLGIDRLRKEQIASITSQDKSLLNRSNVYQKASSFTPKGKHLDIYI